MAYDREMVMELLKREMQSWTVDGATQTWSTWLTKKAFELENEFAKFPDFSAFDIFTVY